MNDDKLRDLFQGSFREHLGGGWKEWRDQYLDHVDKVRTATEAEWVRPEFQEMLWNSNPVSSVGNGISVSVEGAYADGQLARMLLAFRNAPRPGDAAARGIALQKMFAQVLDAVKGYNKRRPLSRTVRLLNSLHPSDMCCLMDERRLWQVSSLLGLQATKAGFVSQHAVVRQKLREAIGPTFELPDAVEQSIFTWYLWEKYVPRDSQTTGESTGGGKPATLVPSLTILPASVQRKGLVHVADNVQLLVAVAREVEQGLSRPDLIGVIQREAPQLKSAGSASNVISQAQGGLALIELAGGAYRPTHHGRELLSNPNPAQALQPLLVGRIFGIGHLLLALRDKPDGMTRRALTEQLSGLIPTRNSLWSGGELVQWAVSSKLAASENGAVRLTDDGVAYADALPPDFAAGWRLDAAPGGEDPSVGDQAGEGPGEAPGAEAAGGAFVEAPWGDVAANFSSGELSSRLILPDATLLELHAALHATAHKRFVLLTGLSGTGKTSVARAYAEAYCSALGLRDWRRRYAEVAVRPDWTDPAGLLGFVNTLADPPTFRGGEALALLIEADRDRSRPYFLCLDEMNLARVEHYFAPFLSAMEGTGASLALHGEAEAVDNVQPRIAWPENLFIFGTVNMDESTHPFSDKVLDRAFTFEFWEVDLEGWTGKKRAEGVPDAILGPVAGCLKQLHAALSPARRHFGYRVADEVLAFCVAGEGALPLGRLLDTAVHAKVLPKLRGDDAGPLTEAMDKLAEILPADAFPRSRRKVDEMRASLRTAGQARFWA